MFSAHKVSDFILAQFEGRFPKVLFSCWISVDSRPKRENKAEFSNFSGEEPVRTLPSEGHLQERR